MGAFAEPVRNAYANGRTLGAAGRVALRRRAASLHRELKKRRVPDRLLWARTREFARIVGSTVPRWLDEVKGMADGAGVRAEDILAINVPLPAEKPPGGGGCTSFVAVSRRENQLFKIRDNVNRTQIFYVDYAPRTGYCHVGIDIGHIGAAHVFNAHAVAGACNTGSPTSHVSDAPRMNDCHILRYFAENASCVGDVPRLFERLVEKRAAGGASPTRGCIFLLADRERGLLLETHSTDYSARFIEKGTLVASNHYVTQKARSWESEPPGENTLARRRRMEALISAHGDGLTPGHVFAISRDRQSRPHCLCNDDRKRSSMTVSAQLQVIPREPPRDPVDYVCCGNPRNSPYVPVPMSWTRSFAPLSSGRFYARADRLYRRHGCSGHFTRVQKAFEKGAVARSDYPRVFREAYALLRREH